MRADKQTAAAEFVRRLMATISEPQPDEVDWLTVDAVVLYEHPQGLGQVQWNDHARLLEVFSLQDEELVSVEIGPDGLIDLGRALMALGASLMKSEGGRP